MKMQFDDHFTPFAQYLDNALNQPSYYPSLDHLLNDLIAKEVTHGDVLEQGISSPLVALAHLVNNPELLQPANIQSGAAVSSLNASVQVSLDMLMRSAHEVVHLAPIQAVPVAAIKIIGKVLDQGELAPAQKNFGSLLVSVLDRSQHMEPAHQKELQEAVRDAFSAYRRAFRLDDDAERQLARNMHGETAPKLVTLLKFDPDNVRTLTNRERAAFKAAESAPA
ncbi:hypothetical protein IFT48_00650 [Pseudomonas fluorescens]|uniref:hypothetical protein n=1 Tax=Pseudomonas fluorescens TaxID=294 RepID=UPI0019308F71|nr:hypothetical protein [Pseudomonas fluorescens]MBD8088500.1 hypothetical protein [Pseudomonas fluorescens]